MSTYADIFDLIDTNLASGNKIPASKHREVEHALLDYIQANLSQSGDIKRVKCDITYLNDNFDVNGLGKNLRLGWAICNGNNGTDNWIFWQGNKRSTLASAISTGATTIDLATGHGVRFPTSGTIMIQGEKITYAGKSTDQLTGVTGVLVNHPAGSTVVIELDGTTYSTIDKASVIEFYRNRLYFISKTTPTWMYYSKLADNTSPETDLLNFSSAGTGAGDAGYGIAPDELVTMKEYIKEYIKENKNDYIIDLISLILIVITIVIVNDIRFFKIYL